MKKIKEILIIVFAIAFVVLIPHTGIIPLPFGYSIPVLLFVWLFLSGMPFFVMLFLTRSL
jgi:hypothetical protein